MSDGIKNHPNVAVISGPLISREAIDGLVAALKAANFSVKPKLIVSDELADKFENIEFKESEAAISIKDMIRPSELNAPSRNKSDRKRNRANRWR